MNGIHVYSIRIYEKQISHDYYCQIVTHEVCDDVLHKPIFEGVVFIWLEPTFDLSVIRGVVSFHHWCPSFCFFHIFYLKVWFSFCHIFKSFPFLNTLGPRLLLLIVSYIVYWHQLINLLAISKCKYLIAMHRPLCQNHSLDIFVVRLIYLFSFLLEIQISSHIANDIMFWNFGHGLSISDCHKLFKNFDINILITILYIL